MTVKLTIYVAAPKSEVLRAREVTHRLAGIENVTVVSTWHDTVQPTDQDPADTETTKKILKTNNRDLSWADAMVVITKDGAGRETYVELGRALARGLRVFWLGNEGGGALSCADEMVSKFESMDELADAVKEHATRRVGRR
jgi:nucleoside 2-deoxyribosyltransferase